MHSQLATEGFPAPNASSTEQGMVLGTVGYMSPEQVRGERVDARTDILSFGAVLYEMLTGARAFARTSATETLAAILRDDPPETETTGRSVPAGHEHVLAKGRRCTGLAWSAAGNEVWFSEWTDGRRSTLCAVSLSGKVRTIWSGPGNVALQDIAADGRARVQTRQIQDGVLVLEEGTARERDLSIYDGTFSVDFTPDRRAILVNERGAGGGAEGSVFLAPLDGSLPTGSGPSSVVDLAGIVANQIGRFLPDGKRFVFQGSEEGKPIRLFLMDPGKSDAPKPLTVEGTLVWQGGDPVSPDGRFLFVIKDLGAEAVDEIVSIDDGVETPIAGKEPRDIPIRWTADGRGIYVFKREGLPVRVVRLDPWTGRKELVKEFMPADPGGITGMSSVTMSQDATMFAFNYRRRISELFLVEGLE